jgi:hypothetical protein
MAAPPAAGTATVVRRMGVSAPIFVMDVVRWKKDQL